MAKLFHVCLNFHPSYAPYSYAFLSPFLSCNIKQEIYKFSGYKFFNSILSLSLSSNEYTSSPLEPFISKSKFQKIIFQNKNSTPSNAWKRKKLNYNISLFITLYTYYPIHISKEKLLLYRITRTSPNPSNIQTILHIYLNLARALNFPHISPHFSSESIITRTVEVIDNRKHLSWLHTNGVVQLSPTLFLQRR